MVKLNILNRWSGSIQFTAEIDCAENELPSVKLGLAVRWGLKTRANLYGADLTGADLTRANLYGADLTGANLTGANLTGANLTGADLTGANLTRANLTGANLYGADLTGADLRAFKVDMWATLTENRAEVPGLVAALRGGKVDGSTYTGPCACLVGTIANVRGVDYRDLRRNSSDPAERWFTMIREGDKPGDKTGGGVAAGLALEWALEWCRLNGIDPDAAAPACVAKAA